MNTRVSILVSTALLVAAQNSIADQVFTDDIIVSGSTCIGFDCVNGESFSYDTLKLKENNLRIRFTDTSNSGSFPKRDWQITINDSANGGEEYFAVEDIDAGTKPFYVGGNAPDSALRVNPNGFVGLGTSTPLVNLDIKSNNTPTLRLEQDFTGGFSAQSWDIGGNEANFFIRDVTNNGLAPFKIIPGAPDSSFFIASDGDLGLLTATPDGPLDVAHPADANNHALLVAPSGEVGINIDNGYTPQGLLDVQTTGGESRFRVESDGTVKLSDSWQVTGVDGGSLTLQSTSNAATKIELKDDGSIIIGGGITVDASGDVTVTNLTVTGTCTGC
ncbi:hypothetical protein [Teredinibacter turnerae]|uniref:hypothetical protein n=1 Tax=Teredinibacter turnerae TaxID=2426 RepID=UPI0003665FD5|nr:hypothetical protein [Teredinibacter turnerae]